MKKPEVLSSLIWLMIGAIICIVSLPLQIGSWRYPKSGLFPFLLGCGIILLSSSQVIKEFFKKPENSQPWFTPRGLKRITTLFVILVFYAMALEYLGFILCTFVSFTVILKRLGEKSWRYAVLTSLIVSILSFVIFRIVLEINLPKGILGI
jgi:putative tricarboxylic transport membrane protein